MALTLAMKERKETLEQTDRQQKGIKKGRSAPLQLSEEEKASWCQPKKERKMSSSGQRKGLIRHLRNTLPRALEILLPHRHLAIPTARRQNVTRQAPRYSPDDVGKLAVGARGVFELSLDPGCGGRVFGPYQHGLVLLNATQHHVRVRNF